MNKVYLMDCMEGMKGTPDKYYDLAVVDPPYGIGRCGQIETFTKNPKHKRKYFQNKSWDYEIPNEEYFNELFRVSQNVIIWGANYFTEFLPPSMGWIFWDKGQDLSMSDGELAFTSYEKALRRIKINRCQLMVEGGTIHPTQKPVMIYDFCFQYAKLQKGSRILDTHAGSMSSVISAMKNEMQITAYEIDSDYFNAGKKRIETYLMQGDMFNQPKIEFIS